MATPVQSALDVGSRATTYSANTLKQYHAAIRQHLRDSWENATISVAEIERIDALLRQQTPAPTNARR